MTTIRLDRYLNLGNSKFEKNKDRTAYRFERVKKLASIIGKDQRSIYNWNLGGKHYIEYDAATDTVLAVKLKAEKIVWRAEDKGSDAG